MALMSRGKETGGVADRGLADDSHRPDAPHYWAFLSYSHTDSADADWLHQAIERFVMPKGLVGRVTANGAVPKKLTPIFRDRHELAASSDLGGKIRSALKQSRFLIVLCSPAAAESRWVNEEILAFKKLHGERRILAAIVGGEPWASEITGREGEECFPPALRERIDRKGHSTGKRAEPIAADLREARDGREAGKLKLIAGMLGLGLDDLVKREQQRRQKRLTYVAAASLAGMTVASGLAVFAFDKRDEARDQRREAEGLVGFMLGDLRDELEPIGRLAALDAVGSRALAYFEKQNKSELSDAALAQRSKALTLMGEIANTRGDLDGALARYREAMAGTAEAMRRQPDDGQRVFDHAQNVFWVGQIAWQRGRMTDAERAMRDYRQLGRRLIEIDPAKPKWQLEGAYGESNLGALLVDLGRYKEAVTALESALEKRERLAASDPNNAAYHKAFGEGLAWYSEALEKDGRLDDALAQRERQIAILKQHLSGSRIDTDELRSQMVALRAAARLLATRGAIDAAMTNLEQSVAIGEQLIRTEPDNTVWAGMAAASYGDFGQMQLDVGKTEQAGQSGRVACDIVKRLLARDATVADWRVNRQGQCLALRIRLALVNGDFAGARADGTKLDRLAHAEAATSMSYDNRNLLVLSALLRGMTETAAGDPAAGRTAYLSAFSAWPRDRPETPVILARFALIHRGLHQRSQANATEARLATIGYRHPSYLRDRQFIGKY